MSEEPERAVPYIYLLQGRDAAEVMLSTVAQLEQQLARFTPVEIEATPAPGKWSLREQMCHLADCEIVWGWRFRQTYGEDNPTLQSFEQDPWARAYAGPGLTFPIAWQTWRTLREWNLALIDTLTPQDKGRPATHPSAGPITLWTLVEIAAGHDLHHLASLAKLTPAHAL